MFRRHARKLSLLAADQLSDVLSVSGQKFVRRQSRSFLPPDFVKFDHQVAFLEPIFPGLTDAEPQGRAVVGRHLAVSRQLSLRAQRAKNPIMAQVTGRFPWLQGMCSTTTPCSVHSTRRGG